MSFLTKSSPLVLTTSPGLTHEQLLSHLVQVDRNALKLCGIYELHGVFESSMSIPVTNKTKAIYKVTAYVPLGNSMFQTDQLINYIYPSKAAPFVRFEFERYIDRSGYGITHIE